MHEFGPYFGRRFHREPALREPRVGYDKSFRINHFRIKEQDIDIDRARPVEALAAGCKLRVVHRAS